jgi:hypothetical protein
MILVSLAEVVMDQLIEVFGFTAVHRDRDILFYDNDDEGHYAVEDVVAQYIVAGRTLFLGRDYEVTLVGNTVMYSDEIEGGDNSAFGHFLSGFNTGECLNLGERGVDPYKDVIVRMCGKRLLRFFIDEVHFDPLKTSAIHISFDVGGEMNYAGFHPGLARMVFREFRKLQDQNKIIFWSAYGQDGKEDYRRKIFKQLSNYVLGDHFVWIPPDVIF